MNCISICKRDLEANLSPPPAPPSRFIQACTSTRMKMAMGVVAVFSIYKVVNTVMEMETTPNFESSPQIDDCLETLLEGGRCFIRNVCSKTFQMYFKNYDGSVYGTIIPSEDRVLLSQDVLCGFDESLGAFVPDLSDPRYAFENK